MMGQISYRQAKKPCNSRLFPVDLDAPCRARTCDPLLPKQMRYRTALRPVLNSDAKVIIEIEKTTV